MHGFFSYPLNEVVLVINILIVAYSVMASIIGAGFASGQEILLYFVCFGRQGIIGVVITSIIFTLLVFTVLYTCIKNQYKSYDEFLSIFKSAGIRIFIKFVTLLFSFAVYGAMLSATGELLFDFFGIPQALGTLICAVGAIALFRASDNGIFTLNGFLGIILVILITVSALYMLSYREFHAFSPSFLPPVNSAFIYSGYNLISLIPVLVTLSQKLKTRSDALSASFCVGGASVIIMGLIFCLISIYAGKINLGELPMITLARRQNMIFATFYGFVLACAIITTLISSGGGLFNALMIRKKTLHISLITMLAYFLSGIGFSNIINTAYRLCGIFGIMVCAITVFSALKKKTYYK